MNYITLWFLILFLSGTVIMTHAQSSIIPAPTPTAPTAPTDGTAASTSNSTATEPAPIQTPTNNSGANMHQGGKEGAASQILGAAANAVSGAMMMSRCGKKCPYCCAMAALNFAQAAMDMAASGESNDVADITGFDGGGYGSLSTDDLEGVEGLPKGAKLSDLVKDGTAKLAQKGFSVDPKTGIVTTPDGDIPAESFNSAGGMSAAGLSASDVQVAQKTIAAVNKKLSGLKIPKLVTSGGGGGGGGVSYQEEEIGDSFGGMFGAYRSHRKPASVEGKSKVVASGDKVGVSGDDIFKMVHRRYQSLRKANDFIESFDGIKRN